MTNGDERCSPLGDMDGSGLSKREYFAAQALTGILTQGLATGRTAARTAVNVADELINALNEENE